MKVIQSNLESFSTATLTSSVALLDSPGERKVVCEQVI